MQKVFCTSIPIRAIFTLSAAAGFTPCVAAQSRACAARSAYGTVQMSPTFRGSKNPGTGNCVAIP